MPPSWKFFLGSISPSQAIFTWHVMVQTYQKSKVTIWEGFMIKLPWKSSHLKWKSCHPKFLFMLLEKLWEAYWKNKWETTPPRCDTSVMHMSQQGRDFNFPSLKIYFPYFFQLLKFRWYMWTDFQRSRICKLPAQILLVVIFNAWFVSFLFTVIRCCLVLSSDCKLLIDLVNHQ